MRYRFICIACCFLIFPALAFAGHSAFDNMTELNEELGDLSGQVAITIDGSVELVDGYVAWVDQDGYNGDADNNGILLLDDLRINGGGGNGPMVIDGLTMYAGTTRSGTSYVIIELPEIYGEFTIGNISLGKNLEDAREQSLGSLSVTDINLSKGYVQIFAH